MKTIHLQISRDRRIRGSGEWGGSGPSIVTDHGEIAIDVHDDGSVKIRPVGYPPNLGSTDIALDIRGLEMQFHVEKVIDTP